MIVPAFAFAVTGYFGYHVFYGDNGIISWQRLERQAAELETEHDRIRLARLALEKKVQLLRPESIDPDLLDERVRAALNFTGSDDIVLYPDPSDRR